MSLKQCSSYLHLFNVINFYGTEIAVLLCLDFEIKQIMVALFCSHLILSLLFLRCPEILHKKKEIKFKSEHWSHRGGAGERLENTMAAFRHATALGTDVLEMDCQVTKDGKVVVAHDDDLQRLCGVQDFGDQLF